MDHKKLDELKEEYQSINVPNNLKERMVDEMKKAREEKRNDRMMSYFKGVGITAAAALLTITVLSNVNADMANVLAKVPVIGSISKVVTFRTYKTDDKFGANIDVPQIQPDESNTENELTQGEIQVNKKIEDYAAELIERYEKNVAENNGESLENIDSSYEVITDTEDLLSIRINTTITSGGAQQLSKIFHVDRKTGETIELKDLFNEGSDYITAISDDILKQMKEQMANDDSISYFIDAEFTDDFFKAISEDQNFYFDKSGALVIVFDEYEVAPGYMGAPEFTIQNEAIQSILK